MYIDLSMEINYERSTTLNKNPKKFN